MPAKHDKPASGLRPHPTRSASDPPPKRAGGLGRWFVLAMVLVALACLVVGCLRNSNEWPPLLIGGGYLLAGTACVAVGLLELEWLERLSNLLGSIYYFVAGWFWKPWTESLADSPLVGRRLARLIWVAMGLPLFVYGCLICTVRKSL